MGTEPNWRFQFCSVWFGCYLFVWVQFSQCLSQFIKHWPTVVQLP